MLEATPKLILRYKDLNHRIAVVVINLMRQIDEKYYKFLVFFQRSSAISQRESFVISREVVNLSHNTTKSRLPCRLFRVCTVSGLGRRCGARHWNLQLLKKFESKKTRVGYCSRCVFYTSSAPKENLNQRRKPIFLMVMYFKL